MTNVRLSRGLCKVVGDSLVGSHQVLEALFISAGATGEPPDLAHHSKWKEWLFRVGQDENVDSLEVLGNILEEFMDAPPLDEDDKRYWEAKRQTVVEVLETNGFRYFQGGRILPNGQNIEPRVKVDNPGSEKLQPTSIEELLEVLVKGLPRAIYPLAHRRKGSTSLSFESEYDIQDLLHALLRPWVADVRPEEFTPSYAGTSTRMDFLLAEHSVVIETKLVRDRGHGRKVGDELIIDIEHYRTHPNCKELWCVVYDPNKYIGNVGGLVSDLEGISSSSKGEVSTKVLVI